MNKKVITVLIPIFIGIVILLGVFYFVSLFWKGSDKKEASLEDFKAKTEIFSSKKQAYDSYINDSVVNVHKENVSISLNSLFSSQDKEAPKELIEEEPVENISEPDEPKPVAKASVKQKPRTVAYSPRPVYQAPSPSPSPESAPPARETKQQRREAFNSFTQDNSSSSTGNKPLLIRAVVHSRQQVYTGATVKLRSTASFLLNGIAIPENTLIYGVVSIAGERVNVSVNSINVNSNIVPVALQAIDRDGIEGVYIPGLIEHELKNESVDQAISEAQTALNVPHIASVPLNVARNRNRAATAILTDNYQLVLK